MIADSLVQELRSRGLTIATAESLTGGLVAVALTDVPGASSVVRGGVVAYAVSAKAAVLGVDPELLERKGAVDAQVAAAMALGARRVFGSDLAIATTGVAGPDPSEGKPVGTVFVAVAGPVGESVSTRALLLTGDRDSIRQATVRHAIALTTQVLADRPGVYGGDQRRREEKGHR